MLGKGTRITIINFALIFSVFIGLSLNLSELNKYLHLDEAASLVATSGYTLNEIQQEFSDKKNIQKYSYLNSLISVKNSKSIADTTKSLYKDDPHLTPAYFVLNRLWMQLVGESIPAVRFLPFLFSLATLVSLYYLCLELFQSRITGFFSIAFFCVSPAFWEFIAFARFYSFQMFLALTSTLVLLRALKTGSQLLWIVYASLLSLSFYAYLFSVFTAASHFLYVVINYGSPLKKKLRLFVLSLIAAGISFIPWLFVLLGQKTVSEDKTNWLTLNQSFLANFLSWLHNFSLPFFEIKYIYEPGGPLGKLFLIKIPDILAFLLIAYAFYFLVVTTNKKVWSLIISLVVVTILPLIVLDIYGGSILSVVIRYFLVSYLGIVLTMSHLLSRNCTQGGIRRQRLWSVVLMVLLVSSIFTKSAATFKELKTSALWRETVSTLSQTPDSIIVGDNAYYHVLVSRLAQAPLDAFLVPQSSSIESLEKLIISQEGPIYHLVGTGTELENDLEQSTKFVSEPMLSESGKLVGKQLMVNP